MACAVSLAAIDVLLDEKLAQKSLELGNYFLDKLKEIKIQRLRKFAVVVCL